MKRERGIDVALNSHIDEPNCVVVVVVVDRVHEVFARIEAKNCTIVVAGKSVVCVSAGVIWVALQLEWESDVVDFPARIDEAMGGRRKRGEKKKGTVARA